MSIILVHRVSLRNLPLSAGIGGNSMKENGNQDRRTIKTQKIIWDTFSVLILEKGFSQVRISDIVSRADINRSTFYLHYRDKYDLLEQMTQETFQDIRKQVSRAQRLHMQDTQISEIDHIFILLLDYMKPRSLRMRALLSISDQD